MIFVTPDGVRSMNTYLGTSLNLTANHIPADTGAEKEIEVVEKNFRLKNKE